MQLISLFSGIGGFELASEWVGWDNIVSCEINPFGQKVLKYYWPNAYHHDDIHTLTYDKIKENSRFDPSKPSIVVGGFPCQPYSAAGKRLGKADDRHLWPEMLRVIREINPAWVVGENVRGLTNWNGGMVFDEVQADLEALGYEVIPFILPACAVNAPHRRDRIWFVAYRNSDGQHRCNSNYEVFSGEGLEHALDDIKQILTEDPLQRGCLLGKPEEERTEDGKLRDVSTGDTDGVYISEGDATNTSSGRPQTDNPMREPEGEVNPSWFNGKDAAPNSSIIELQGGMHEEGGRETERHIGPCSSRSGGGAWENFPTQPPVRWRNDGISPELSGITVPKHRQESIKAYGNAVVPQVVYEIFKVINTIQNNEK